MKRVLVPILAASLLFSSTAFGAVSEAEIQELREQLALMSQRLDELAAENADLRRAQDESANAIADVQTTVTEVAAAKAPAASASWADRVGLDGDFRYRYERIDAEGSDTRRRNRIRARFNVTADLADDLEVGFGLATGGDDPVSTNQTLGGGGSSKDVSLNLAYADWQATDGTHLIFGKYNNPLYRPGKQPLMWDSDWTPEGLAFTWERDRYFVNAIGTYLESDSRRESDSFSWGTQLGATGEFAGAKLTGGLGYYSIKTQGNTTTFGDPSDPGDYFGNTAVQADGQPCGSVAGERCFYLYDYLLTQVFAEAAFDLGGWPTTVFFDYVNNTDAADDDTGWTLGGSLGAAKDRGQFRFTYYYAEKEADALLGLLTDSDFAGGGTD
ncbi:MAG TPA: putative porin, partial [Woeseiaceae bacterium]|nr:putative porin [Woeseiaceae bacterium]